MKSEAQCSCVTTARRVYGKKRVIPAKPTSSPLSGYHQQVVAQHLPQKLINPAWIPGGESCTKEHYRGAHTTLTLYASVFSCQRYQQQIAPHCFLQSSSSQLCKNLQATTMTDDFFFCIFCVCIYNVPSPHEKNLNVTAPSLSFQEPAVVWLTLNRYSSKL